ncbi:MAG: RNA-binding protein [Chromatiales bacterium]|nr:RNA-binding protein [Chromatiales bacterium]
MRLDKWLWVARFFKTRNLAQEAIEGGKVHINGQRSKPGKEVGPGSMVSIRKGEQHWEVEVLGSSKQRRPANEAQQLYRETDASLEAREKAAELRRLAAQDPSLGAHRPSKRDRRQMEQFTERRKR